MEHNIMPLVSVIIPVYNGERFLAGCLRNLGVQEYKRIEVIFIDDSSSDTSVQTLLSLKEMYNFPIQILFNSQNKGTGFSRNKGIKAANGDYILFLDQDDEMSADGIVTLVNDIVKFSMPDLVIGGGYFRGYKYNPPVHKTYYGCNAEVRKSYFRHEWYEMPWNKLIRREFLINNELYFKEDIWYEDTPWSFLIALKADTMVFNPKKTYTFKESQTQKTSSTNLEKIVEEQIKAFETMFEIVEDTREDKKQNKDAIPYLLSIVNNHLLLIIRNKLSTNLVNMSYRRIRSLNTNNNVLNCFFSREFPNGLKLLIIYRFLPYRLGLTYIKLFDKLTRWRS